MADPDWQAYPEAGSPQAAIGASARTGQLPWQLYSQPDSESAAKPEGASSEPAGVGMDVLKSGAAGALRNAPISAMTAPQTMWDLAARGVEKMVNLVAPDSVVDVAMREAREAAEKGRMHRFEDVSKKATEGGVPDYEPQTTPGRFTKTIAEGVPLALTGNEGAAANVLKGAVAPGVGSEALGDRFKGTWLETPARLLGGIAGGAGAYGAGAGVNAVKTHGAAREAADAARTLTGGPDINAGAVARVAKSAAADNLTPEGAAAKIGELGPESMMLDMGRQLQGRAEAVATQPGVGQNKILDAVEGRTGEFGSGTAARVKGTLDTHMGESPNVVKLTNDIGDIVDKHAKPLYDSVMEAHPVVQVPADITSRPSVAQAMKDAVSLAKDHGEKLTSPSETQTILKGPGYHIADDVAAPAQTSLRYWDYVKKAMDHRINGMMKSGGVATLDSSEKADLGGMIAARNALRDHLDEVTEGAYKTARSVAATKPQLTEALEFGRSSLSTKLLPEEMAGEMENFSIPQQSMARVGMRREIERVLDTARNDGAAARRILDTNQNREKIAAMFGEGPAAAIDARIAAETKFQDATNKISANSRTGVRSQLIKDTETPSAAVPPMANLTGFATKGLGALANIYHTGAMERTRSGIGSLMTTPADKIPDLVKILSGYNERAAANARPALAPYAGTLAKVLGSSALQRAGGQEQR